MHRSWQWLLGLLVSVIALVLVFQGVQLSELWVALQNAQYGWLVPALTCVWLGQWLRAHSWRVILGHSLTHQEVFSALNAGYLLNNVLPLRLGELGRAYLISRTGKMTVSQALSSVVVERVVDLCMVSAFLVALLPTLAFPGWAINAVGMAIALVALGLTALYVMVTQREWMLKLVRWVVRAPLGFWQGAARLEDIAEAFIDGLQAIREPRRFILAAVFSGLAWFSAGASLSFILLAFQVSADVLMIGVMGYFTLAVTALSIALPSAPGSLGVWQWAVVLALSVFGVAREAALSVAILHHAANYAVTSVLGALALAWEHESLTHLAQSARSLLGKTTARRV